MRGFLLGLSVSIAFIVGALSSRFLFPEAHAKEALNIPPLEAPTSPRWEYICYRAKLTLDLLDVANQAGDQGWEMFVTDGQGSEMPVWCFKRQKLK